MFVRGVEGTFVIYAWVYGTIAIDFAVCNAINDLFFGVLDAPSFAALSAAAGALVKGSRKAVHYVNAVESEPPAALDATA